MLFSARPFRRAFFCPFSSSRLCISASIPVLLHCDSKNRSPPDMHALSLANLRAHLMCWSITLTIMVVDDAAMLALMFC
jgi:hypothetical protein